MLNSNFEINRVENLVQEIKDENENHTFINNKNYISTDSKELALFFKEEGNKYFMEKKFDVALVYFTRAIDHDNTNKIYYSNRSACYMAKGFYYLALQDALKCIELDSEYSKGYFRASLAHWEMNQLDKAIKLIEIYKEKTCEVTEDLGFIIDNIKSMKCQQEDLSRKYPSFHKFHLFTNWLYENEVYFSKLDIHFYSDDHRGILAKHQIYKDEVILKVPRESLITLELAKTTEIGSRIATFMYISLLSPKHCLMTSFILGEREKGEKSKWKVYLDVLPRDYSTFPIFYSDEELLILEGSPFLLQILEKKSDILKDYEKICNYIPEFSKYNYKEFSETRMAISSRIFGVKIDNKKTDVLAPFADLLNHKRPRSTHWFYDEKYKSFIVQSLEDISKGSEVYDSYGKKCNSRFLLNYGFIIEENDANEYPITLELDETFPNFEEKKKFFSSENELVKIFKLSVNILDYQVVDFFSYLRFILYDGDIKVLMKIISDNKNIQFDESSPSFYLISPIDRDNEIKVLKKIEQIMLNNLAKYKTTLEEDMDILNKEKNGDCELTTNEKNCIIMRLSEKQILKYYLNFAHYCIKLYDMSENEICNMIDQDFIEEECTFKFYVYEVIMKLN